ncbi:MAG: prolyl oligopeptidase family serine peptidase [Tepidisphaera sp.]|nr:prolyl oligopeptidase family serine peptidase [Tepidisphaera sp.]
MKNGVMAMVGRVGLAVLMGAAGMALGQQADHGGAMMHADKAAKPSLEQFLKIRTPGAATVLPDGTMLVRDWPDGVYQLYKVTPRDGSFEPGKATFTRLTEYTDGLVGYSLSPDGTKVVLLHAFGGNENTQLTYLDPKTGATAEILENPKVQAEVNMWLPDSSGIIYSANDASPSDFYLYRYDFAPGGSGSGKATRILAKPGSWAARDISADGTKVLVSNFKSASDTSVYELDVKTGELKDITIRPQGGTAACEPVGYLPGGSVLMTSDVNGGLVQLFEKDLSTGNVTEPLEGLGKFELDGASLSVEKDMLVVAVNEDGYGVPRVFGVPDFKPVQMPEFEKGVVSASRLQKRTLTWTMNNARKPGLAYETTWDKGGTPTTRQLTYVDDQGVDLNAFALPELVKYQGFDGTEIAAFVYTPKGFSPGTPVPFVAYYHGGPEGQSRPTFSSTMQYLVSEGYGIIMPNPRGSTGYGRQFQMMDDYKNRWNSVRDGVDAAEWLVANKYATPGKIATFGGSYGGFMSVACLVEDQERVDAGKRKERLFGAGIDVVGIVNLKTFLEKTSGYRRKLREAEYGPLSDPDFLASVSSINKVDKINVPMFIAHGYNDPRVPVEEAIQLALALKAKNVPTQLFIAPDEGHGFQKLDNRMLYTSRAVNFLGETIGKR